MASLLEKGIYTTLGMFLFMQEKAGEAINDLIDRGRLAPEEGRRFMEDLNRRVERESKEIRTKIDEVIEDSLRDAGLITKADINQIKFSLSEIEDRLTLLEGKQASKTTKKRGKNNKVLED